MTQKSYYRLTIEGNYEDIIKEIKEKKPELKSSAKVVELALNLLHMQVKGEIIRFVKMI